MKSLAIVIPTINEEKVLPKLLLSLKQQTYQDFEVIVADSDSKDMTAKVAMMFGAKVIQAGKGVSRARNAGAAIASSDSLLFVDADVQFPDPGWLGRFMAWVAANKVELAHTYSCPDHLDLWSKLWIAGRNFWEWNTMYTLGWFIFCSRSVFDKVGGFNEKARIAEDGLFGVQANKTVSLYLYPESVIVSLRRYRKQGYLTNAGLLARCGDCTRKGDFDCAKCEIGSDPTKYPVGVF